jgi:hypothetical protein
MEFHRLNNNDLLSLLEVNSINEPLHKRLETDFVRKSPLKQLIVDITASVIPKLSRTLQSPQSLQSCQIQPNHQSYQFHPNYQSYQSPKSQLKDSNMIFRIIPRKRFSERVRQKPMKTVSARRSPMKNKSFSRSPSFRRSPRISRTLSISRTPSISRSPMKNKSFRRSERISKTPRKNKDKEYFKLITGSQKN